jgi:hypothetical protein
MMFSLFWSEPRMVGMERIKEDKKHFSSPLFSFILFHPSFILTIRGSETRR